MNRAECIVALTRLAPDATADEIADIIWLAMRMGPLPAQASLPAPQRESLKAEKTAEQAAIPANPEDKPASERAEPIPRPQENLEYGLYAVPRESAAGGLPGKLVRVAAARPLHDAAALGSALRPLKKRIASRTDWVVDIIATVDRIADGCSLAPVLRPARERWLDLTFVIDEGVSMRTWDVTLAALRRLLEHHGAFRRFQVWNLQADSGNVCLYLDASRLAKTRRVRPAAELIDSDDRRLILVASDCISEGWRNGAVFQQMMKWGNYGPVALLQMLPERLWPATALGGAVLAIQSRKPSDANARLFTRLRPKPSWRPQVRDAERRPKEPPKPPSLLPVLNLEDWSLRAWAAMLTAKPGAVVGGVDLKQVLARPTQPSEDAAENLTALDRIRLFSKTASPIAYDLACYLSETPLCLPVMRLVQEVMLPDSTHAHLAEVVLGGLMKAIPEPEEGFQTDALMFQFHEGVDTQLQSYVVGPDRNRVQAAVSGYLARRAGGPRDFLAAEALVGGQALIDPLSKAFGKLKSRDTGGYLPNRQWIMVVGTGLKEGLPQIAGDIAKRLGRRLAMDGYNALVGEWPGVDYLFARAYVGTLRSLQVPPRGHVKQFVERGWTPDFPGEDYLIEQIERDGKEIDQADAVVLIGGQGSTMTIFEECVNRHKIVLPIAGSGGDAAAAFLSVIERRRVLEADFRILSYLARAGTADEMVDRTAVVLRVLFAPDATQNYRQWARRVADLLPPRSVAPPVESAELRRYLSELNGFRDAPDAPPIRDLLPDATEWLRYDYTQLTVMASDRYCASALASLTPLVMKYLPRESNGLIRAAVSAAAAHDPVELFWAAPQLLEPAEIDELLQQVFELDRLQFELLLRLWAIAGIRDEGQLAPLIQESSLIFDPGQLLPLLINKDRRNRHLAFAAFIAFPVRGAANAIAQAVDLEVADPEGLSPLWADCVREGLDIDPLPFLNHPIIDKALRDAFSRVASDRDPSGGWSALVRLANEFHPAEAASYSTLTHDHVLAFAFVLRHILSADEWTIIEKLANRTPIKVPARSDFRTTIRRLRDRQIVQGGRVSVLEDGSDLSKSFSLTQNAEMLLEARKQGSAIGWMAALLVFNLVSRAERMHLRELSGDGGQNFSRSDALISELRRLRDRGLIVNSGSSIGRLPVYADYRKYLSVTSEGRAYLSLCSEYGVLEHPPERSLQQGVTADCVEFLLHHLLTGTQKLHLNRLETDRPAGYDFNSALLKDLRWLRSLRLISSRRPLHEMPQQGDLDAVVSLTAEGYTYLDLKRRLSQSFPD
jgi:hypothetical protein